MLKQLHSTLLLQRSKLKESFRRARQDVSLASEKFHKSMIATIKEKKNKEGASSFIQVSAILVRFAVRGAVCGAVSTGHYYSDVVVLVCYCVAIPEERRRLRNELDPPTQRKWPLEEVVVLVCNCVAIPEERRRLRNELDPPTQKKWPLDTIDMRNVILVKVRDVHLILNINSVMRKEGFYDFKCKYIGGMWLWIEFDTIESCQKLQSNKEMSWYFTQMKHVTQSFKVDERVVWIKIGGLPLNAWTPKAFKKIACSWGEPLFVDKDPNDNVAMGRVCIKTCIQGHITNTCKVVIHGKSHDVRVKEFAGWVPDIEFVDSLSGKNSAMGNSDNQDDDNSIHVNSVKEHDVLSIGEPIIECHNEASDVHIDDSDNLSKPPGFENFNSNSPRTSTDRNHLHIKQTSSSNSEEKASRVSKPHSKLFSNKGLMIEAFISHIEMGNVLGYDMEGSKNDLKKYIDSLGANHGIQKTHLTTIDPFKIKNLWGNSQFHFALCPSSGRSGGLVSIWDSNSFIKHNVFSYENLLIVEGTWTSNNMQCFMVNVYAPQEDRKKESLWHHILEFKERNTGHYFMFGDFNAVRFAFERIGGIGKKLKEYDDATVRGSGNLVDNSQRVTWLVNLRNIELKENLDIYPKKLKLNGILRRTKTLSSSMPLSTKSEDTSLSTESGSRILKILKMLSIPFSNPNSRRLFGIADWTNLVRFTFTLYKKFWDMIKVDVVAFVQAFFSTSTFPRGCNASFIALISKGPNPMVISNFRPISLIGAQYKIIAKVMANRLALFIDSVISHEQSAFIKHRQILDGPLMVNEVIKWCQRKKSKLIVFKINFEKAFDSVSWEFLIRVMHFIGFSECWINWIKGCLYSASSSILINGSPTNEFNLNCGLRQGDPLSPFLFIIAMEGLHVAIEDVLSAGLYKGIKVNSLTLSHFFFADDALLIGERTRVNLKSMVSILECFYRVFGLKINLHKSNLIRVGVPLAEVHDLASIIGCNATHSTFLYLGLLVDCNMANTKSWDPIVDKFSKRLSKWKSDTLSIGGRATLISSVLGATAIHGENGDTSSFYNHVRDQGVWGRITRSINIMNEKGLIPFSFLQRRVSNGISTSFWHVTWLGDSSLENQFPRLFRLALNKDCSIRDCWNNGWSFNWIHPIRSGTNADQLSNLLNMLDTYSIGDSDDYWLWSLGPTVFTIKSTRTHIDEGTLPDGGIATRWNR
nr:RNA-directed DNA polymerase, eukaryota [Tanacetum cinerariifolium]